MSAAMAELFPPFAVRILRIGEQGGRLPKSLGDIAAHYDREAGDSVERMIGALEPTLTLLIGALLAWVVLAVLGPIYGSLSRMNDSIAKFAETMREVAFGSSTAQMSLSGTPTLTRVAMPSVNVSFAVMGIPGVPMV